MKKIIILLVILLGITPANATEISKITSSPGMTQAQWEMTDQYKSFVCPEGSGRGIGVDMNFTADRSDDIWFATCNIREIVAVRPANETTTITAPIVAPQIDTETIVVVPTQSNTQSNTQTQTVVIAPMIETKTVVIETSANTETSTAVVFPNPVTQLSDVIWVLKNQIILIQKLYAKILTRTKGVK